MNRQLLAKVAYTNNELFILENKYCYPKHGCVYALNENDLYIASSEIKKNKLKIEDVIIVDIDDNNEYNHIVRLFNVSRCSLIANIYNRYCSVLNKKQINKNFYYINDIAKFHLRVNKNKIIFTKNNGIYILADTPNELVTIIKELEKQCATDYYELQYDDTKCIQIKKELVGCRVTKKEHKRIMLEMMEYFDKLCRDNDLKYSISGGTMLGAIRNGGFIPWDDDADIIMTRPEFEKMLQIVNKDDSRFRIKCFENDVQDKYTYARVLDSKTIITKSKNTFSSGNGIFVDIMPIDGTPNNKLIRIIHYYHLRLLFRIRRSFLVDRRERLKKKSIIKYYLKKLLSKTDFKFWMKRCVAVSKKYDFDKSNTVANLLSNYKKKEFVDRKCFDSYFDVDFEGKKFMICSGYEMFLKNLYKNYTLLPKKRKGHHINSIYWL